MKTLRSFVAMIAAAALLSGAIAPQKASAQLFTGGDVNIAFLGGFSADIAPIFGYKYNNFSIGISPVLQYTVTGNISGDFAYGGRVFAEYLLYKGLFGHAEFGALYANHINWDSPLGAVKEKIWVLSAPVGVGYEVKVTDNVLFKTMILYDALLDLNLNQGSPLANPQVRGGFTYLF